MSGGPIRRVTIVVHQDGALASHTWRAPVWVVRAALGTGIVVLGLIIVGVVLYAPIVTEAARVPGLVRDVERLETENDKVGELVAALDSAERRYERIRGMMGADLVPDRVQFAAPLAIAPIVRARVSGLSGNITPGPTAPQRWPLEEPGYITRGLAAPGRSQASGAEPHPGVDIAIAIGTPVRASGGGRVLQAGEQEEYGRFVLIEHPDGYQTMYGHLSRVTVATGQPVDTRQVIGLSGNTGRSSAPHLHFEIRRGGQLVDPGDLIKEHT